MRDPSPASRSTSQTRPKGVASSSFGFGNASAKSPAVPALRGKSSRNVLKRKPSSVAQNQRNPQSTTERSGSSSPSKWSQNSADARPSIEASLKSVEAYNEIFTRPPRATVFTPNKSPAVIPELDRYRTTLEHHGEPGHRFGVDMPHKLATQDLPPPTPLLSETPVYSGLSSGHNRYSGYSGSGYSASPSTRFSESPGPGAYSRDTTPTSMSSQSPGIVAPLKILTPRLRQGSPAVTTRPPVTRRRAGSNANEIADGTAMDPHGLPSLLESLTSSSSNSTVKVEHRINEEKEKRKKKKGLSPSPPSPPPRKSSQKFKKPRSEEQESPSKASQAPAKPIMSSPSDSSLKPRNSPQHASTKSSPPVRPSREGAPDLQSQLGASMAVIQSNLAGIGFSQNRRQSALPRVISPLQPQIAPRSQQGSRLPSRNPSPTPVQPSPREATPAPAGLGIIPDLGPQMPAASRTVATRTPSPSLANTKPRFGLFGRRTKTAPEIPTVDSKEKALRKGPTAGTGHEGYGRLGLRGRSTSATGVGRGRDRSMSAASSSQDSIASTRTHDPFLLERMSPVIIAGGGDIVENRNASSELSRSESNTSLLLDRPSMDSKDFSTKSSLSHEVSRTTLWPSALPKDASRRTSTIALPKGRRPSDSSDDGVGGGSSLAFRRSVQRLSNASDPLPVPRPLNLSGMGVSGSMTSLDASIMSNESDHSKIEMKRDLERGRKGQLTKPKKLEKRLKSPRKWNFFHRSQPAPKAQPEVAMQVTLGRPPIKPIPHYAMLDSSDEQLDPESMDLEDILRDADVISLSNEELDALQFGHSKENLRRNEDIRMTSPDVPDEFAHLTSPPVFASPEPMPSTPEMPQTDLHLTPDTAPVRPSRLPQVGRIPKVISARPLATSPKSFSRPFARLSTHQPLQSPIVLDKESVALGTSPPKLSAPEPPTTKLPSVAEGIGLGLRQGSADSKSDATEASHRDFLAFSPRKNSEATTSSSGDVSFMGTTAVIPEADAALEEDEVWDEYDDLMENDDTIKVPVSATSSHGHPFQYESYESRRARKSKMQAKESPTIKQIPRVQQQDEQSQSPPRRSILTSSSIYSTDMNARLKDALTTIPTPTTPMSFTDFFQGYGDRNNSFYGDSAKKPRRSSQSSSRKSTSSSSHSRRSGLMAINEEHQSPISHVNLRVGSMTVSKWLTFGHVLFSPARESIMQTDGLKRHSILVIDGLGNDDWSFYAAETYPTSTFYNLSPTRPLSASQRLSTSTSFPLTPPNHRQVQYLSSQHKFPFPSSTFHVVVFRFPSAMSEASYRNIISEAKRVLLPGGYLEIAILDLDMMNMGNRLRRAVRALKVQMQIADPGVNLGSVSDLVLKCVGKRGFTDVKSCNVGVPVASAILSNTSSDKPSAEIQNDVKEELSLAEMMKDSSAAGDEGITKMVAKVGRWWYTRCYEMGVIPDGDFGRSIFTDPALLNECEKWNSSFKLVVAYAQKPVAGRGRGASV
ncbi:hypothetical protein D0Z07_6458 [Hyphodiscus hymeniophilus]|uniref:Methyltransferase type 11 domain-containing protein n=1 Tax=Hyphodiscus hymeniophilus TaxID=353542 RepID=A0A9P7AUP2_9HELO|nr:hypothetical protein D0Z07_6458 [Hyphodiscus hymeniophilus]